MGFYRQCLRPNFQLLKSLTNQHLDLNTLRHKATMINKLLFNKKYLKKDKRRNEPWDFL